MTSRQNDGKDSRRRSRWGAPAPAYPQAMAQAPRHEGERRTATISVNVVEPYVSDAEAIAALVGSSTATASGGAITQSSTNNKRHPRSENNIDRDRGDNNNSNRDNKRWRDESNNASDRRSKHKHDNDSYYGRGQDNTNTNDGRSSQEHNHADGKNKEDEEPAVEKKKADFGLSGALATDSKTGNTVNGVLLKFNEPPEARIPADTEEWRLYLFEKTDKAAEPFKILAIHSKSAYLIGRDVKVADIPLLESDGKTMSNTCSKQHCVLQYRGVPAAKNPTNPNANDIVCKPYLMDLKSTNGTFINGTRIDDSRYYELRKGDVLTMGRSDVEYVLLTN
jgi:smad nuclear-interacting protein 1